MHTTRRKGAGGVDSSDRVHNAISSRLGENRKTRDIEFQVVQVPIGSRAVLELCSDSCC
jgi:hypothetical protein